ncbi:MAG: glycine oxidase ThiO [Pseudonocardia sp.]|nr:glycine oxidase ThiO [Pseudonocardia sp.]
MTRHSTGGQRPRLVVVGGGVIGLSCAWRASAAGWRVVVVDPEPARGASWVAGGMLAPITEAWPGDEAVLALGVASLRCWPDFAGELAAAGGIDPGLRREGTLAVAATPGDRAELDAVADHLARHDLGAQRVSARELRSLEPAVGPDVSGGLAVPGDLAVDNRALLAALRAACDASGVEFELVAALAADGDGVELQRGRRVAGDAVLIAAGAHSGALHPALHGVIRPVKGEIVRLAHRAGALPPPVHTVRAVVQGRHVYAVPRDGGGLVVGATQVETGFDTAVTVGGVRDLLRDAERVLPGLAEFELVESAAGLRPGSPDNVPLIGRLSGDGPLVATGHHRNGMLLAPITADAVLALLSPAHHEAGLPEFPELPAADPARFAGARR